jgi:hypothetical protein
MHSPWDGFLGYFHALILDLIPGYTASILIQNYNYRLIKKFV